MAQGKAHSEEVRAQVMAALLAGQGVTETASQFGLNERVIRRWREAHLSEVVRLKKERIAERVLDYLDANLDCLKKQCEVMGNEEYIKQQHASDLAVLHGVVADKGFKILEAFERNAEEEA